MKFLGNQPSWSIISFAILSAMSQFKSPAANDAVAANLLTARATEQRREKQITQGPGGRILTHIGVWSPDSEWIVYDTRSDAAGSVFDGSSIQMANIRTGEVRQLYHAKNEAHCGVVTFHPHEDKVVFILGPEHPDANWQYGPTHRQGLIVAADTKSPPSAPHPLAPPVNLDACDLTPPFTPGALRGGSHVHVWDAAGEWVSFTYEDDVLARFLDASPDHDINQRNLGVSIPFPPVQVKKDHPRNHNGEYFSVVVTKTTANPKPGSDEIKRAFEEGWVGANGYTRSDGTRAAPRARVSRTGRDRWRRNHFRSVHRGFARRFDASGRRPAGRHGNPRAVSSERLRPASAHFYGQSQMAGPPGSAPLAQSSPDGSQIAFLMKDDAGIGQLWTVSPTGGSPRQVTHHRWDIASAFTWSPDGQMIAHVMDNSVCVTQVATGHTYRLTSRADDAASPRPEACVFSPDGNKVAYVRRLSGSGQTANQIFMVTLEKAENQ